MFSDFLSIILFGFNLKKEDTIFKKLKIVKRFSKVYLLLMHFLPITPIWLHPHIKWSV